MRSTLLFNLLLMTALAACDQFSPDRHIDQQAMNLARINGCLECHALHTLKIGPPWFDIAQRYRNLDGARSMLIQSIKKGSQGKWSELTGGAAMPANGARVSDKDVNTLVDFILSLDTQ